MDCRRRLHHQPAYRVQRAQHIILSLVIIVYRINSQTIAKVCIRLSYIWEWVARVENNDEKN